MTLHESALEAAARAVSMNRHWKRDIWDMLDESDQSKYRSDAAATVAAYRAALRVTTRDELDALPVGAVVLTEECVFQRAGVNDWTEDGWPWHVGSYDIALPALVLHIPEAAS